jgi:hypothetical protein
MTRTSRTLLATLVAVLAAPAAAPAATVSLTGGKATFTAATGEANRLTVRNSFGGTIEFEDTGVSAMTAGTGCTLAAAQRVRCLVPAGFTGVVVDVGDGNDNVDDDLLVTAFTIYGGLGSDILAGGGGADTIDGGAGNDAVLGGDGDDVFVASDGGDWMRGDAGRDTLSYAGRTAGVSVTPEGVANDGQAGEGDNVADGSVEDVTGGAGNDSLTGTDVANNLTGGAGDDTLTGTGGDDLLDGGTGIDSLSGGAGIDVLKARDGAQESFACGTEADVADADWNDNADADCEVVNRDAAPPPPPAPPVDPPVDLPVDPAPPTEPAPAPPAPPAQVVDPILPPSPTGGTGNVIEPPVATIATSAPIVVNPAGVAPVRIKCPSEVFEGCAGTIVMEVLDVAGSGKLDVHSARRRKPKTRLASRRFKVAAGQGKTVPVRLDRRVWRKFKKKKRVKVQVTITMETAAGTTAATQTVTLKPQPPKRKKGSR